MTSSPATLRKPDYGVDAPAAMRNLFLAGALCLLAAFFVPWPIPIGKVLLSLRIPLFWTGGSLLGEALLFLLYVKVGKRRHRDFMLSMHTWRGDEQVLDVGCGRGLLLIGAAKHLTSGHAAGIDIWSNVDMGANSTEATTRNLTLEGVADRCTLVSLAAQSMTFPDAAFDVIVSNLCLHNLYQRPQRTAALQQIARVLAPGGIAILSDYKRTREYAQVLSAAGLVVTRKPGNLLLTFPPLAIVIARKPV